MIQRRAFDVTDIQSELELAPEVWNTFKARTQHPQSPHREVDDIWVRYNPIENFTGDLKTFNEEHIAQWYPVVKKLPSVKSVVEEVFSRLEGLELGAVLITRIPAGAQVYPHVDLGWHARHFEKYCVQIKGNMQQAFKCKDEERRTEDGDVWWFDNSHAHWVTNNSDEDRITLIICIRRYTCH